ncbi:unnamed protein product [Symbiodinium sp. CCMP2592]|nr:unnamed protein product [Symbiodinium sp. CCMP2592]
MFAFAIRTFVVALLVAADAETCVDGQCPASPRTAGGVFMQMQTKPKRALVESKDGPHILHQCPATQAGESFGNVQTSQVDECSGLAASRVNRGVYWVNNDSGDGPKLYGLTREGKHVARLRIENSRANDWEDVAIGPGPEAGKSYIYVGDVGDNRRQRGTVQIYRVEEPNIPNGRGRNDDIVVRAERFDVTYPDGMKYDCEAVFIDQGLGAEKHGTVGRLYLITKGDGRNNDPQWRGGDVFYVDLPARGSRLNFVKTSVRINVDFATGADITSQGNVIAIRSYGNVLMWPRPCQWTIEDSMSRDPCYVDKKNERQGEAIAFGKDGDHYITISEGKYQPVWWFAMTRKFQQEMMSSVALLDISGPGPKGALVPIEPRIANVCPATGGAEWKGKVWSRQINECSGLAASRLKDDVYWINNDSGDRPRLYAINLRGDHLARIKVVNVDWANDWEELQMGRGKTQWPEWKDKEDYHDGWSSSTWSKHGWSKDGGKAKQAGKGKDKNGAGSSREEPAFPSFEAMVVPSQDRKEHGGRSTTASSSTAKPTAADLVQGTQKLVNQLRKAESKVRRGEEELVHINEQWRLFQEKLKKAFLKERGRYMELVRKNKEEQEENLACQESALAALQDVLNGGVLQKPAKQELPTPEEEHAWALIMAEEETPDEDMGIAGLLTGALNGQGEIRKSARQKMLQAIAARREALRRDHGPVTPPSKGTRAPAMSPPAAERPVASDGGMATPAGGETAATYSGDGQLMKDPYLTSPSAMRAPTPTTRQRSRSHANGPRVSVKSHLTLKPGTLAKKLAERREAAARAGARAVINVEEAEDEENDLIADLGAKEDDLDEVYGGVRGSLLYWMLAVLLKPGTALREATTEATQLTPPMFWALKADEILYGLHNDLARICRGFGVTLLWISLVGLIALCRSGMKGRRGRSAYARYGMVWGAALALKGAAAMPSQPRPMLASGVPRPTDLELWAAGLLTPHEQLLEAEAQWALGRPLEHGAGEARLPTYAIPAEETIPDFAAVDIARVHATCWIATPFYEAEIVDLELHFPTTVDRITQAVRDSTRELPDYADDVFPTVPQLGSFYASFVAVPRWVRETDKVVQVVDATDVGGGIFAAYLDKPVTRQSVLLNMIEEWPEGFRAFSYGGDRPWRSNLEYVPVQGGVLKIVRPGGAPRWADELHVRTGDPTRWNPDVPLPAPVAGLHTVYQSADDQVLEEIASDDERPLEVAAEEALNYEHGEVWIVTPTERIGQLSHRGRRVWGQIAVLDGVEQHTPNEPVIFTDLRGLGLFPQWTQLSGSTFRPLDYYDTLGMPDLAGWAVMVEGGEPHADGATITVQPGEVLAFHLKKDEADSDEDMPGDDGDGDSSGSGTDDSSDGTDALPDSSEMGSPHQPVPGEPPRGPPRPEPVNRPRSRSPRRRAFDPGAMGPALELANMLPPPTFDLGLQSVQLPLAQEDLQQCMGWVWDTEWMAPLPSSLEYKPPTVEALRDMKHWSDVLLNDAGPAEVEVHLYSDGSWLAEQSLGGYAVAVIVAVAGAQALMGAWGERTHGGADTTWDADTPPALHNEQVALATGLLWILQSRAFLAAGRYVLHYDCMVAGKAVDGAWKTVNDLGERSRLLEMYLQEIIRAPIEAVHVKAHRGDPLNELVDVLSKEVAAGHVSLPAPPRENCSCFLGADMSWLATAHHARACGTLPIDPQGRLCWSNAEPAEPSCVQPGDIIPVKMDAAKAGECKTAFELKAFSLNAQSLRGKHKYFESQLMEAGCHVALFQEAKGQAGVCESKNFLRFSTQGCSHWGVSIWINKALGICCHAGKPYVISEDDVRVIEESPRLLVLAVDLGGRTILLVSGHAPHATRAEEAADFFEMLWRGLRPYAKASLIVMGVDLNGRIPLDVPGITGTRRCGDPDKIGEAMLAVARKGHLWFPSTFDVFHEGTDITYRMAGREGGSEHRIDYLILGGVAAIQEIRSWVAEDYDTMAPNEDHEAVMIDFAGLLDGEPCRSRIWRPKYDVDKLLTPDGRRVVEAAMWEYAPPAWTVHPTDHYEHFRQFVHRLLEAHFALPVDKPRSDYISDKVWMLRKAKIQLKQRARHRKGLWRDVADRAFLQWATGADYSVALLVERHALLYELVAAAVQFATARIKKGVSQDKARYLRDLALSSGDAFQDVVKAAKKAGVGGRTARTPWRPMPALKDARGCVAATRADKDKVWLAHFGAQECGKVVPTTELIAGDTLTISTEEDWEWHHSDLPTILELETAMRRAPRKKAVGLDGVPGELLLSCPPAVARALYALVAKTTMKMCQPLHWRGGILQEMWKRTGSISNVESYRSLYISSLPAKCFHRLLRDRAGPWVETALHPFQMGARKCAPVLLPALYIQAFLRWAKGLHHSVAIIFVDFQSAYYRVIRELAVGGIEPESDEAVARVFQTFGLPPEDTHLLYLTVKDGGMMGDAGAPPGLRHLAKDMMFRSWFVTRHGSGEQVNVTRAGSRPGSSWADIIYAFVLGRLLAMLHEHAVAEDLLTTFPVNVEYGRRIGELLVEFSLGHGMLPNLRPKKTAVILALRGKGAQQVRRENFTRGRSAIPLPELGLEVQVAPSYVHLGGLVEPEMRMMAEARRRLGIAQAAFDAGKALLYCNGTIPLDVRASLFRMSVTGTCFNLALWVPKGKGWELLQSGFTRILKGLLSRAYKGDAYYKLAAPAVHILTGTPCLATQARRARISLLISMCRTAPPVLWAVLQHEREWLDTVKGDLEWLRGSSDEWPGMGSAHWPEWHNILTKATPWVKRQLAKREKADFAAFRDHQIVNLALWGLYRRACALLPQVACATTPWYCRMCSRTLRTKAALGAHFFKVHKRKAAYRRYGGGTVCRACQRNFWARTKLMIHLRDSPRCVAVLAGLGPARDPFLPGLGSRGWRAAADEDYTPALPLPGEAPARGGGELRWPEEMRMAYKEACDSLLDAEGPNTLEAFRERVLRVLGNYPLYYEEAFEIIEVLIHDVAVICDNGLNDYWTKEEVDRLVSAMKSVTPEVWTAGADQATTCPPTASLSSFAELLEGFEWDSVLPSPTSQHETYDGILVILDESWKVAWLRSSEMLDCATVLDDFWSLLPEQLRGAWDELLKGREPTIQAMFVDQLSNGRVYVITKGDNRNSDPRWRGGDLFYIDLPAEPASDLTFQETGIHIPVEWATGADMTPNGGIISIRSYGNVLMWPRNSWESVEQSMAKDACFVNKANERQGEAIAFGKNGDHYITVSEGRYPPVWYFSLSGNYQQALATSMATE